MRAAVPAAAWHDYWQSLADGDAERAASVALELHRSGIALEDVLDGLVAAGQAEVGRRWAVNEWNVAREHRATSVSEEVVVRLDHEIVTAARDRSAPERGQAVVSCVDGEWHALPSKVVATVLRQAGWKVHFLGASVPVSHLAQFIHDVGPDVTALSCSIPVNLRRARQMIEASREAGVPVLAGGPGFGPAGRWALALGANATAADARGAVAVLEGPGWQRFTGAPGPLPAPDDDAERLSDGRREVVDAALEVLRGRWPAMAGYNAYQLARTEEDLGFIVDFLGAALFVDDVELFTGFVAWNSQVLAARGVPRAALGAGIEAVSQSISATIGTLPRAAKFLEAGLRA